MPTQPLRNRIKGHRRVRLGDLLPHELNPRRHPDYQKAILARLYEEVGYARSVLAYELPDGRLKLIDGHLRASVSPEETVDVEILDVTEEEAQVLLLSIDPLAQLATEDDAALQRLRALCEADSQAVRELYQRLTLEEEQIKARSAEAETPPTLTEQFYVLVYCQDEAQQVELLTRFTAEGLHCQAKLA